MDDNGNVASNVYAFAEDSQQRVWIATMGTGLFCYELTSRRVTHYPQFDSWIDCLYYSHEKNSLFLGTYYGVSMIDLNESELQDHHLLYKSIIYSFYEAKDGHMWVGSSTGLLDWDVVTDSICRYTTDDGLCNNFVCAIHGGDDGYLWMSTSNGLSRFHPSTRQFTNYYVDDGLQGNEFSKNASWCDRRSGFLYFGGVNGITYFKPTEITATNRKWHVRVTDFYIFGKSVKEGMTSGGRSIIDRPAYKAENFYLSHSDNAFTIEFSTMELDNTDRVVYMCSLNDDPWITLQQGTNQVSFSNLAPGKYEFRLKAIDGEVESEVKKITIYIAQPWWNTWWAWLIYVWVLMCVVALVVYQLRQRYQARQERLRLLRAEELNEEKLQFFINVSHDIRTPMTLILSPLRKLMTMDKDEECQKMYRTIHRNAERILGLVNQLMDIRKIDKGQMHLVFHEVDVVPLLDEICGTFVDLADMKNISFKFTHEGITEFHLWIDVANFDKIVLNILSNAFKFTPNGGEIELTLSEKENAGEKGPLAHCAELRLTDSGVGIDAKELERIFDRFYQTKNILDNKGTGVGLHLTRSLVNLHHGQVFAENRDDGRTGSRFVVRLPMGCDHLRKDEMGTPRMAPSVPLPMDIEEVTAYNFSTLSKEDEELSPSRSRYGVLIVEDDEEIRRYLRQELSDRYRVAEATNGREALDYVFKNEPDLVISDIMMAEMDGLTLCRKIKQNIRLNHIPVVLLTARTREEDNLEGLNVGADAYMTKPFSVEVLRHTVRNLLQSREQLRTIYSGGQQTGENKLEKIDIKSPDERMMERIMKVVNQNMSNKDLSVEMLASEVGLSRSQLHRKLKELTNQSTRDFLRNVRMKQAAQLLSEKNHAISEVAQMVGYDNLSTFSVCFKDLYGVSPSAYRRQHSVSSEGNS